MIDMEGEHDDEPTRWTSIGWQALLITNRLRCQAQLTSFNKQEERTEGQRESGNKDESKHASELEYVERRLSELRAFERRANGAWRKKD
jgi:hypothetical protein